MKDRHQQVALLNDGYITPAMVPAARQNPEAFDGFLTQPECICSARREFRELPQGATRERQDAAADIAAQLGLSPDALD